MKEPGGGWKIIMKRAMTGAFARFLTIFVFLLGAMQSLGEAQMNHEQIAERILTSLHLQPGERVLIRYDPIYFAELVPHLRRGIRSVAAVDLAAVEYVQDAQPLQEIPADKMIRQVQREAHLKAFTELLNAVDVYLWLPADDGRDLYDAEADALRSWLKKGGTRRQLHFHWKTGSVMADGLAGEHSERLDQVYQDALNISYEELSSAQDRMIALLRSGKVQVTTPEGTNLSFTIGARPFNKQDGNATAERAQGARIQIDREIELPAGVIRVAPIEDSVNGVMVIPSVRFDQTVCKNLKLQILQGRVTVISAEENEEEAEKALKEAGDVALRFREFGLGMNPRLVIEEGSNVLPYYGYGAGVVRLSLGDNQELGGNVRGGYVRWFFFPNATIKAGNKTIVSGGKLSD
jgi:leucyl aminopeptidase (aminopeptidase T)